MELIKL